jgi:hypothetical protein
MPPAAPGSLDNQIYRDVLAYVLQVNGVEAGEKPLPGDPSALGSLAVPHKRAENATGAGQ